MEYTRENHLMNYYTKYQDQSNFRGGATASTVKTIDMGFNPVEVILDRKQYWIDQYELDFLNKKGVPLEDIKLMWYVPGSTTPFGPLSSAHVDGYEFNILY
jgi:hypothetical protein